MHDLPRRFGTFEWRPATRQVLRDGAALAIGARAFDVLPALIERRDRTVSKSELIDIVWPDVVVEENNLQVQVSGAAQAARRAGDRDDPGPRLPVHAAGRWREPAAARRCRPPSPARRRCRAHATCRRAAGPLIGRDARPGGRRARCCAQHRW